MSQSPRSPLSFITVLTCTILIFVFSGYFHVPDVFADGEIITTESGAQAVADEYIIKYKDSATYSDKQEFKDEKNLEKPRMLRDSLKKMDVEQVGVKEAVDVDGSVEVESINEVIAALEKDPAVEYVEPNYIMSLQSTNDPSYSEQWSLTKIGIEEIWKDTTGSSNIVIAILDTGLDYSHPDKPRNLVPGYDFINDDSNPQDDHGHGTFVAGVIAANTNNGTGVAGICRNCSIMPVKVMDSRGIGTYADVANGIVWAADNGADIINLSIGGYAYSQILQDAVIYAQSKGALIIAAGGNQGISTPLYPAAYSNVIGVSATTQNDEKWSGSNYGSYIDISAPGVGIYGLTLGSYRSQTGTSVAAPHIAGVAGLLMSKSQGLSPNLIAQQLYKNTIDLGPEGKDYSFG
ncbi:MAG: S8 family peptidase, partial [Patescibacteria group bacterium]